MSVTRTAGVFAAIGLPIAASVMFARGVPILQIKENLGHEDLATTQIYAHLLPPEGEAM